MSGGWDRVLASARPTTFWQYRLDRNSPARVPGRIPISTFEDHVVMEDPLETETKSARCCTRSCIQRIASPLHAPISEIVQGVAKHQVHRLRRASGTPQRQTEPDRPDFNDPLFWLNIEKACLTACFPA